MTSIRSRLIIGSLLWTIGLLALTSIVTIAALGHGPSIHFFLHNVFVLMIATACLFGGFAQLRKGLAPLDELRSRLIAMRDGLDRRVGGNYPTELQPLVNDLNSLLEDRDQRVARALAKAGDLAHGLKTPLAVLFQEAERATAAGQPEVAAMITQQVLRMQRQVEYHLAHARAAAAAGQRCPVEPCVEALARTMMRLYAERGIAIHVEVAPEHQVRGHREGLDEMLGNLLDNACKWAKSRVEVRSSRADDHVTILVDDDGPGLAPSMRDLVLKRGVRADEAAPGSGLGLSIVSDLAELHGGTFGLEQSSAGGVRARLVLPAG